MKHRSMTLLVCLVLAAGLSGVLPAPRALAACAAGADYRSAATGNWGDASSWECYNGSSWETAASAPTSSAGTITIRNGHTISVATNVTVDQVIVDAGGQVSVNGSVGWAIDNGTGVDLTINGVVLNSGLALFSSVGPTWAVNAGGTYIHNTTSGISIPLNGATLDAASNFIYRGSSSTTPAVSTAGRTYGNLTFESQSGSWSASPTGTNFLTVNGNFVIGSGVTYSTSQSGVMTFAGNFTVDGTLTNGSNTQVYTFTGNGKTIGGTSSIVFETWNVTTGAFVTLNQNVSVDTGFIGTIDGTLHTGTSSVAGAGAFTLASGGTLGIGDASGIATSGAAGNIQVTGTRTYSTGANYTYNGSSAQVTGSGLPATVNNLTIDNTAGVSFSGPVTVNGTLTLTNGRLTLDSNNLTIASDNAIAGGTFDASKMVAADGSGALCKRFGTISGYTYPIGDATGTAEYSPVTAVTVSGTPSGSPSVCFRVTDAAHPNRPNNLTTYITRYWTGTMDGSITGLSYDATFNFVDADKVGSDSMNGKKWNGSFPWVELDAVSGLTFLANDQTSFSDFTAFKSGILAVTLAEFSAQQVADYVQVSWETVSEIDNRGFNLYRGVSPDGWDRQLNALLIPSQGQGSPTGFIYTWDDHADLVPGTTYYYWVEDVDISGAATLHGPVSVDYVAPTAVTLSGVTASPAAGAAALPWLWVVAAAAGAMLGASRMRR